MKDEDKSKKQLLNELLNLRQRVAELEASETERTQMWKELEAEKNRMDSIVNSITSGIVIVRYDYKVQFQNKFLLDRFGDCRGKLCYKEHMNRDKPCSDCPVRRAIENRRAERTELTAADGRNYEFLATPIQDPDGTMLAVEVVVDITERKRADQALRESEEKHRSLFENANDAIFIADTRTNIILDVNRQAEELIGRPREEIIGMHQAHLHPPQHRHYYKEKFRTHVQEGSVFDFEPEVITKDGRIVPVIISSSVIRLHGKDVIQALFRDISKEKEILDLKEELAARKLIEKAKGILMNRHKISEKEAVRRLQRESRRQRSKIKEVAQAVISSEVILE